MGRYYTCTRNTLKYSIKSLLVKCFSIKYTNNNYINNNTNNFSEPKATYILRIFLNNRIYNLYLDLLNYVLIILINLLIVLMKFIG